MSTYFTDEHEWITLEDDGALIGITAYAAEKLGEVVYLELKEAGFRFNKGDVIGIIESVKVASDIYAPLAGEIVQPNSATVETPALLNKSPEGDAWLYKIKITDKSGLSGLMNQEAYQIFIGTGNAS
jgi:glycine cleavage system H protein